MILISVFPFVCVTTVVRNLRCIKPGSIAKLNSLQDDMSRNEDPNQYVVHDPLLEKGKEKFNKEQAKFKKRNREWAGKSLD